MDNDHLHNNNLNKPWSTSPSSGDFDKEANEGWEMIGKENWDEIQKKLSKEIDTAAHHGEPITLSAHSESQSRKRIWSYGIAASVLVVLGIGLSVIFTNSNPKQSSILGEGAHVVLYEQYYRSLGGPEDNYRSDIGGSALASVEHSASEAFNELDYKQSISFYSELLKESPQNPKYTLFLGLSYINDGRYDDAILLFNNYTISDHKYDEDIQWYLALAHLRKGEIQTSRLLLHSIASDQKSYYSDVASELITKMTQLK